jgi:hypothetical protein
MYRFCVAWLYFLVPFNQDNQCWLTVVDTLRTYNWSDFEMSFGQILSLNVNA